LLDGLLLSNAQRFQHWLDRERDMRHAHAMRALEHLARTAEQSDPRQAIAWWQRLAALDPHSGPIAARVIGLLAANGDNIAALAFARRHEETLRNDLDFAPSAEVVELIRALRRELQTRAAAPVSSASANDDRPT
jgi:DNA-binding SARP family transcriptional activator